MSSSLPEIQTVDLDAYARGDAAARAAECAKTAASLHATGCLYVKDARVAAADNERFLDLLERYFAASDGQRDARPELHYQVGVTPAMVERPRDHCARVAGFDLPNKPLTLCPPEADPKWRYFWRVVRARRDSLCFGVGPPARLVLLLTQCPYPAPHTAHHIPQGPRPASSRFPQLNHEQVIPPDFADEWEAVMDMWGSKILEAVTGVAALAAEGFGLPADAFTKRMQVGVCG